MTKIRNCPEHPRKYVVYRVIDDRNWYYGSWDDLLRASEVALEVEGFIQSRERVEPYF